MELDRRTFLTATLGAAGALVLGACVESPQRAGIPDAGLRPEELDPASRPTLRLAGGNWGFPSPFAYFVGPGYVRMSYIYDTLLWVDSTGALLPWLASDVEASPDGLSYRFGLRDGVRWNDGAPLTPEDVVFTFRYFDANRSKILPFVIVRPEEVAEARVVGDRAVEIRLAQPLVTFLTGTAARVPIVPQHVWSSVDNPGAVTDAAMLVGTGPYRLESHSTGQGSYLFTANDEFFLGTPFVKRIEMLPVGDQLLALLGDAIDGAAPEPLSNRDVALAPFRGDDAFGILEGPKDFALALYWNLSRGGALADRRFRHACASAIDRGQLVERLLGGRGEPGNPGFLPQDHPFHVEVEKHSFDPTRANQLLDDVGYRRGSDGVRRDANGTPLRFDLLAVATASSAVELLVEWLEELGVELVLRSRDFAAVQGEMTAGSYDMAIVTFGNVSGDPNFMRTIYSGAAPASFLHVPGYDGVTDIAERQRLTLDEAERKELVAEMQRRVADDLPMLPLLYPAELFVFRRATFNHWTYTRNAGFLSNPYNKQVFVTGVSTGGTEIRPIAEGE